MKRLIKRWLAKRRIKRCARGKHSPVEVVTTYPTGRFYYSCDWEVCQTCGHREFLWDRINED